MNQVRHASDRERLRLWENELRQREEALLHRQRDLAEREEHLAAPCLRQRHELLQLEQRIRNARRRLLALTEEYERLREKLARLQQNGPTQLADAVAEAPSTSPPIDCGDTSTSSSASATLGSQLPQDLALLPLRYRLDSDLTTWLSQLAEDLLDRAAELRELATLLAELRSRWLQEWQDATQELALQAVRLAHWESELTKRQEDLERAEAELAQRQQDLQRRQSRFQAAELRAQARLRACEHIILQVKARWRAAAHALRQRECRLQWLLDQGYVQNQQAQSHWLELHRQAQHRQAHFAALAHQTQSQLAQLELARYRLWQKQQALELAINTWLMQTDDPLASEKLLRHCEQILASRLGDWQRRLESRERQLTEAWLEFQQLAQHLASQKEQLEAARRQFFSEKISDQWHAYCQWAALHRELTSSDIAQQERFYLRQHTAQLLRDLEHLATCFLAEPEASSVSSQAA